MGRYIRGDIEGKMWFGVQSSDDASFFGGDMFEPSAINFSFTEDDLPQVKEGISECEEKLGEWKQKLDDFFTATNGYNDAIVEEHGMNPKEFAAKLKWYARLRLGKKILKCLEANGSCDFEVDL